VDSCGTAIGLRGKDGVVIAVDKPVVNQMAILSSSERVFPVTPIVAAGGTGLYPDLKVHYI